MLQISTGKFFTTDDLHVTRHRGALYTNYRARDPIETAAGALRPLELGGDVAGMLCDIDERLEARARDGRREFLVSVGATYRIEDFAAVVSFGLGITCTADVDLARRLTQAGRPPLGMAEVPRQYVRRVFDREIAATPADAPRLQGFVADVVGLKRADYEAVMRAVRRYSTGLHRIAEDVDLAYVMLVAPIESLAQEFDGAAPRWADVEHTKRTAVDRALEGATPDTQDAVRGALLAQEHVALARRYREFALAHVEPAFFRDEAIGESGPVRRFEVAPLLARAYAFRSTYLHTLQPLPRILTSSPSHQDVVMADDRRRALTVHGLARLARHVITTFVSRRERVEREDFEYRSAFPNVVRMQLAESFWVDRAEGYNHQTARHYLIGFLNELARALEGVPGATVTDLSAVLAAVERGTRGLAAPQRLPMLALYLLYNWFAPPTARPAGYAAFIAQHSADFEPPSVESMVVHVLTGQDTSWARHEFEAVYRGYVAQRTRRDGIALPPVFDAAITLTLAELHRREGDLAGARAYLAEAVDNLPGHPTLLALERTAAGEGLQEIAWSAVLLPHRTPPDSPGHPPAADDGAADRNKASPDGSSAPPV